MKRLSLDDICKLQKASVIWMEMHNKDTENGFNYFRLFPMLVCVPEENGVLAYADTESIIIHEINENLIVPDRLFWDSEPEKALIDRGLSWDEYNSFLDWLNSASVRLPDLISAITLAGIHFERICLESGISEDNLKAVLIGEKEFSIEEKGIICNLLNLPDEKIFSGSGKGKIIDFSSRRRE